MRWVIASIVIFTTTEILLGGLIGNVLLSGHMSISLRFLIQGLLNLSSYFIGGIIIGLISPGIRIYEPAIGAFCSVAIILCLTIFTPYSFMNFSLTKLIIGGVVAFFLALSGAKLGEKIMGNKLNSE